MIYRTLHTYILRELLRVFLLTASTLTTLLAFGGMFRPLTKQGVDISQVMALMFYLMPAMLAYAIPIAALFAAVLVYWRMSTDNELTACRAGGVAFTAIVLPAFMLGVVVASMDLVFVNYVVPRYLQLTERALRSDVGSLIVGQINRQEKFQYEALPIAVTADSAEQEDSKDPNVSVVTLHGMVGAFLDRGKPTVIGVAQKATITIRNLPDEDAAEVSFSLTNGSGFDPNNGFHKATGSFESVPWSRKFPSIVKSKAKFLNWRDLIKLDDNPSTFPPVAEVLDKIEVAHRYADIEKNAQQWWARNSTAEHGVTFEQSTPNSERAQVVMYADLSQINTAAAPEESLTFSNRPPLPASTAPAGAAPETKPASPAIGTVKVELRKGGKVESTYRCEHVDLLLEFDQFTGTDVAAQLRLRGNVMRENNSFTGNHAAGESSPFFISGLTLDPQVKVATIYTTDAIDAETAIRKEMVSAGSILFLTTDESTQFWSNICSRNGWNPTFLKANDDPATRLSQLADALRAKHYAAVVAIHPEVWPIATTDILNNSPTPPTPPANGTDRTALFYIGKRSLIGFAKQSANSGVQALSVRTEDAVTRLYQSITSELHSRASFSLSCLTLVMLGAALGILLRGKNPLAVFVMGFVPAIVLVLLITAGRQLTEGGPTHTTGGITLIWAGNGILLAMVVGVYATLLRK